MNPFSGPLKDRHPVNVKNNINNNWNSQNSVLKTSHVLYTAFVNMITELCTVGSWESHFLLLS